MKQGFVEYHLPLDISIDNQPTQPIVLRVTSDNDQTHTYEDVVDMITSLIIHDKNHSQQLQQIEMMFQDIINTDPPIRSISDFWNLMSTTNLKYEYQDYRELILAAKKHKNFVEFIINQTDLKTKEQFIRQTQPILSSN